MKRVIFASLALTALLVLGACATTQPVEPPETPEAPETTEAPPDTEAPPETSPPDTEAPATTVAGGDEDGDNTALIIAIVFGLIIIGVLIGWLVTRNRDAT